MKKLFTALMVLVLCSGCVGIGYNITNVSGVKNASKIYIVEDIKTKEGFLDVMATWLKKHNYEFEILDENADKSQYEWVLTYNGKWSWDAAIYLSDAEINVYKNGIYESKTEFNVKGGAFNINPSKYGSGENRVREMMNKLFGHS